MSLLCLPEQMLPVTWRRAESKMDLQKTKAVNKEPGISLK